MLDKIKKAFFKQSETCSSTSILYRDILNICGNNNDICLLVENICNRRNFTGLVEAVLTFISYFHFKAIEGDEIKIYFTSYGGSYNESNYNELYKDINKFFYKNEKEIEHWLENIILQTNETARSAVIFPSILSLNLKEINLVELGSSAGLIMYMDKFSYEYTDDKNKYISNFDMPLIKSGINNIEIIKNLFLNRSKLNIKHRLGLDINPLDLTNDTNIKLLKSTIWDSPERLNRLQQTIETQKKYFLQKEYNNIKADYTNNLADLIIKFTDTSFPIVLYTSVSTYQISDELYNKMLEQINSLTKYFPQVYFIEFEAPRKTEDNIISDKSKNEPFMIKINNINDNSCNLFAHAHFHGLSMSLV